jgi:hypothetical protein
MSDLLILYLKLYFWGLLPFIALTFGLLFIPMTRIRKAISVALLGAATAAPVAIALGWGVVIAPIAWAIIGTPAQRAILLLQFNFLESASLHILSIVVTLITCFFVGYYLMPRLPFSRSKSGA